MSYNIIRLKNIKIADGQEYLINEKANIKNDNKGSLLIYNNDGSYESNSVILRRAIELAIPNTIVEYKVDVGDEYFWDNHTLFSFYGDTEYNNKETQSISTNFLCRINKFINMIINNTKVYGGKFSFWNVAYNEYVDASYCRVLELTFVHLITALEAMLLTDNTELKYRVSLYTAMFCEDTEADRREVYEIVRKAYDLRSKTVHGDIDGMKKHFKNNELYKLMFKLREIVSKMLEITYGRKKEEIVNEIEHRIFK